MQSIVPNKWLNNQGFTWQCATGKFNQLVEFAKILLDQVFRLLRLQLATHLRANQRKKMILANRVIIRSTWILKFIRSIYAYIINEIPLYWILKMNLHVRPLEELWEFLQHASASEISRQFLVTNSQKGSPCSKEHQTDKFFIFI